MVIHRWNNEIQEAVIEEWTEGCQEAKGRQALRILRKRIAEKYALNTHAVQGIIELGATQGLSRVKSEANKTDGHSWEPINYHELVGDLKGRVRVLERKFEFLLDGIQKVLEDGEAMTVHIAHLRKMGKWMKKRDALDMEEMTRAPLDENERPRLPDIESRNTIDEREELTDVKQQSKGKRGEIKTKPRATYNDLDPMEKIDRLRTQADSAMKRGKLLFQEIEEGKKAIPRQGKQPTSP
jgi:hypothetical protein